MTTRKEVLKDLEALIGMEFDENEIIIAFSDLFGDDCIEINDTGFTWEDNEGMEVKRYIAYPEKINKPGFLINVDRDNKVHSVADMHDVSLQ